MMQDDIAKMNDNLEKAREGFVAIDNTLKRKQLLVNYYKNKFMLMGSKKFGTESLEKLKTDPMVMGGVTLEHAVKEKYLGDCVHELGCKERRGSKKNWKVQRNNPNV